MKTTKYIWHNGKLVKWEKATTHILSHTLHYGGGAFEGIRLYETPNGPAVFRLREHIERLNYSASVLQMEMPYNTDELCQAVKELVSANGLRHGYIRPLVYFGYGVMGLNPKNAPVEVAIACWPWGAYLPHEMIDVKTSKYIRISPKCTVADAKLCGNYVNSILAALEIRNTKYHEALFLDENGLVAEGPGENFFIVKNGAIITPRLGSILAGITRDTVFAIAKTLDIEIKEENLSIQDAYLADEAFFTGTAAEVTPIHSIDDKIIGNGKVGPITGIIRETYLNAVHGKDRRFESYLAYIAPQSRLRRMWAA